MCVLVPALPIQYLELNHQVGDLSVYSSAFQIHENNILERKVTERKAKCDILIGFEEAEGLNLVICKWGWFHARTKRVTRLCMLLNPMQAGQ